MTYQRFQIEGDCPPSPRQVLKPLLINPPSGAVAAVSSQNPAADRSRIAGPLLPQNLQQIVPLVGPQWQRRRGRFGCVVAFGSAQFLK